MAPAGPWDFLLLLALGDLFFARKRDFLWGVFFVFWGGVVALSGGAFAFWGVFSRYATIISRAARFFLFFPPRGGVSKTRNFRSGPEAPWPADSRWRVRGCSQEAPFGFIRVRSHGK